MAYGSNHLGSFFSTMLGLREQRLKEELAEAEMQQQAMQQMGKGIGDMFSSFGNMAQQGKQDAMANQIMSENPAMMGGSGSYSGGTDEMDMRIKMAQMQNSQMGNSLSRERFEHGKNTDIRDFNYNKDRDFIGDVRHDTAQRMAQQQAEAKRAKELADEAIALQTRTDGKQNTTFDNSQSYLSKQDVFMDGLNKATDERSYRGAARSLLSNYAAAKKAGLPADIIGGQPPQIPPYLDPAQKQAIEAQQKLAAKAQKGLMQARSYVPGWGEMLASKVGSTAGMGFNPVDAKIQEAQSLYDKEQQGLSELQGQGIPYTPDAAAAATGATSGSAPAQGAATGNTAPEGTRITLKGQNFIKQNGQWVLVQ